MIVVQIAGRLGRDAESRFTPSGQKVTTLNMATNIRKAGKDETVWWRVVIWGDRYDKMIPYFKKGSALIVVGEMNKVPDIWTDKDGRPNVNLEITAEIIRFNGGTGERQDGNPGGQSAQSSHTASHATHGSSSSASNHSHTNFGNDSDDFGASAQNGASRYAHDQAEEAPPF